MTKGMDENKDPFPELGSVYRKGSRGVNELGHGVENINLGSAEDGKLAAKTWSPQNSAFSPWGRSDLIKKLGMQSTGKALKVKNNNSCDGDLSESKIDKNGQDRWDVLSEHLVGSTQVNGWTVNQTKEINVLKSDDKDDTKTVAPCNNDYDKDDPEIVSCSSDGDYDYDYDSDDSEKSHESCKKIKLFKVFFDAVDKLSAEEVSSVSRRWHCPACQGGPGAIGWYRGLESLIAHARTKRTRRARLHRLFAEVLNEELHRRDIQVISDGEAVGRWEGLGEEVGDFEIVWPPMVVVMNTRYEREENGKWIGMGSKELLDNFRSYAALRARHSYGPQGHRGMSLLIFDSSAAGYLEAIRLHMHFVEHGRDRNSWVRNRVTFCPGGKRQLYGYVALKEDLDIFNEHSEGKLKLKFEMKLYKEMVYSQLKKLQEESKLLSEFRNLHLKELKESLAPSEPPSTLGDEHNVSAEQNCIFRPHTVVLLEQKKKEISAQQQSFEHQIQVVHQAIDEKEVKFEKLQLAKREKDKLSLASPSTAEGMEKGEETCKVALEEFEAERKKVIQSYVDKKAAALNKYWEDQLQLEKVLENELTMLMDKYKSQIEDGSGTS